MEIIHPFPSGPLWTNAYVIACPSTREAAIIDPAPGSTASIERYLTNNSLKPLYILLTHSHWDHIAEVTTLKDKHDLKVAVHELDSPNLENPGTDRIPFSISIPPVQPDILLKDGDLIKVGTVTLQVIHTPGHSGGSVCFYDAHDGILISGDTAFKGTIGNLSFHTGRPDLMGSSLQKLADLPSNTIIYPGHGPVTTIGQETKKWEKMF